MMWEYRDACVQAHMYVVVRVQVYMCRHTCVLVWEVQMHMSTGTHVCVGMPGF